MRRRTFVLTATATAAAAAPARVGAQTPPIRIGAGTDDAYMQPYYAVELGLFKKAGLDVEIVPFANSSAIVTAAAAGAVDIGMGDPIAVALANLRGIPFAYFAGGPMSSIDSPTLVLCVAKSSTIRTAKDLEGKTVAIISLKSLMGITTSEWLTLNGADGTKVKFYELRFPQMPAALARGTVDAALIGEPFLTGAQDDVRRIGVPFQTVAKLFYIFGWFGRRDWIAAHADATRKLAGVLYDVARWANTHHPESAAIESKYTKIEPAIARVMARNPLATSLDPALLQSVLDMATRYKLLERPVAASELIATF